MSEAKKVYLSKVQLKAELDRCLNCKNEPCMHACPVHCNPRAFIEYTKNGNTQDAVKNISDANPMGQTCGLICPDKFCMKACTRAKIDFAINIPKVQATIMENFRTEKEDYSTVEPNGKKIAIIGGGPAGIAAATSLAKKGYVAHIFEKTDKIGGALNLIPQNRLPQESIDKDWAFVSDTPLISVNFNTSVKDVVALLTDYDGVIVTTGEPNTAILNIKGEEHCVSHMDYLKYPDKYVTAGKVAVIGGGNVAADCAFTAAKGGAEQVDMFVRRKLSDMRISKAEYLELIDEHINVSALCSPESVEKTSDGYTLTVHRNRFRDKKLEAVPETSFKIPGFALIIKAVGSFADEKVSHEKVIYAGDCKTGGSTLVEALASGKAAAEEMHQKLC